MDPGVIALMIPVLALVTGLVAVLKMPREAFLPKQRRVGNSEARLQALEEEVGRLRGELADAQERLDFTERLVAGREPPALPGGE